MDCTVVPTLPTVPPYPPTLDWVPLDSDQHMDRAEAACMVPAVPHMAPVVPPTVPAVLTVLVVHMAQVVPTGPAVRMDRVE